MAEIKGIIASEETVTGVVRAFGGSISKEDLPSEVPFVENARLGEYIFVKEIDENGNPKWGTTAISFNGSTSVPEMGTKYLRYSKQVLSEADQAQARANIGAVSMEEVLEALPVGEEVKY